MIRERTRWSELQKIGFRFFAVYFFLYVFPFPLTLFSHIPFITEPYATIWDTFITWTGKNILHLSYEISKPNGSGDTTYNYVQLLLSTIISLFGSAVWSIADRKRNGYDKGLLWLTVGIRYYVAVVMLSYGFAKIFYTQFSFPNDARLAQTYGDSSPMGLLWTFMGYSLAYNIFTGFGEALGGFLLFFRRTTTIGALLLITILSNVVMLNFAYDVPVKLFSSHLLLLSLFLTLIDWKRVFNFLTSRTSEPKAEMQIVDNRKLNVAKGIFKGVLITWLLGSQLWGGLARQKRTNQGGAQITSQRLLHGSTLCAQWGHPAGSAWRFDSVEQRHYQTARICRNSIYE